LAFSSLILVYFDALAFFMLVWMFWADYCCCYWDVSPLDVEKRVP